jgi:hypothetical protein
MEGNMGDLSTDFIKAWERYTGLEWDIDHQGGFGDSYRDFKAGWDAAKQAALDIVKCACGQPATFDGIICPACRHDEIREIERQIEADKKCTCGSKELINED